MRRGPPLSLAGLQSSMVGHDPDHWRPLTDNLALALLSHEPKPMRNIASRCGNSLITSPAVSTLSLWKAGAVPSWDGDPLAMLM
jgi:hypothetical protein